MPVVVRSDRAHGSALFDGTSRVGSQGNAAGEGRFPVPVRLCHNEVVVALSLVGACSRWINLHSQTWPGRYFGTLATLEEFDEQRGLRMLVSLGKLSA